MTKDGANSPSDCSLAQRVNRLAKAAPTACALKFESEALSYSELDARSERMAAGLAALGVARNDSVCVLFDTSCDYVAVWLALGRLGAIEVPINTGFRGAALAHALRLTGAKILLADEVYRPLIEEVLDDVPAIETVVLRGKDNAMSRLCGRKATPFDALLDCRDAAPGFTPMRPGDPAMLLFTSGSTGPSKGCTIPHRYVLRQPEIFCRELGVTSQDVLYAPFPLFHADGAIFTVAAAFAAGATAALAPKFSVSGFWNDCRRHDATMFDFMGATLAMLYKQPHAKTDKDHNVRLGWGVPTPPWASEFEERFGVELVEVYGLSDAGIVLYNSPGGEKRQGSCGRVVEPFDVRIHDADGFETPVGEAGELVIRANEPHLLMSGYYGDVEATAEAFRDLWFHTGDIVRCDDDGFFFFVGREKDVIRRRGENISAFDVEQALLVHDDILEAAAYGVPSELTEEDLMVTVVVRKGCGLVAQDVVDWAASKLSPHMVPRYVRMADAMPRTGTEKIAKHELKALGVTADAQDFDPRASKKSAKVR